MVEDLTFGDDWSLVADVSAGLNYRKVHLQMYVENDPQKKGFKNLGVSFLFERGEF